MSLETDGVWKSGVWAFTVWADGVWREGDPITPANQSARITYGHGLSSNTVLSITSNTLGVKNKTTKLQSKTSKQRPR